MCLIWSENAINNINILEYALLSITNYYSSDDFAELSEVSRHSSRFQGKAMPASTVTYMIINNPYEFSIESMQPLLLLAVHSIISSLPVPNYHSRSIVSWGPEIPKFREGLTVTCCCPSSEGWEWSMWNWIPKDSRFHLKKIVLHDWSSELLTGTDNNNVTQSTFLSSVTTGICILFVNLKQK